MEDEAGPPHPPKGIWAETKEEESQVATEAEAERIPWEGKAASKPDDTEAETLS